MDRRDLLKTMGAAAGTVLAGRRLHAAEPAGTAAESVGILIDTTRCIGCRSCELACAEAHQADGVECPQEIDFSVRRTTSETQWTVVNRYDTEKGEIFAKKQCMHCLQPACASACLTKAMHRTPPGPVAWTGDKCMGCRFCMVSCPFDVPKFEYHSANPRIQKCAMCWDRVQDGGQPACVENCPAEALTFGPRSQLIEEARRRIYADPGNYVHAIYGEHEAGGTGVLYLASVPFEQLGLRTNISDSSYPALTREFLYAVPVVLTLVPPLLVAMNRASNSRSADAEKHHEESQS